ncbi:MAG: hypothetical protein ABW167_00415 [Baekduia sp.]
MIVVRGSDSELRFEMPLNDDWTHPALHAFGRDLGHAAGIVPETVWAGVLLPSGRGADAGRRDGRRDGVRPLTSERDHQRIGGSMHHLISTKRRRTIALGLALVAVAASVAAAAWMLNSNGQGAAKVGTLSDVTVSAGDPTDDLYPGNDGAGTFTIDNPNGALVLVATRVGDGSGTTSNPACGSGNLSINPASGLSITVPSGHSSVRVPGLFHLSSDAPSSCQGAKLTRDVGVTFATPTTP